MPIRRIGQAFIEVQDENGLRNIVRISAIQVAVDLDELREEILVTVGGRTIPVRASLDELRLILEEQTVRKIALPENDFRLAEQRMSALRSACHAVAARYDRCKSQVIVSLNTGVELSFPPELAQGLADASPDSLAEIEISPAGHGLHWPQLDADVYLPALLQGVFGSKSWMTQQPGAKNVQAQTSIKEPGSI